MRQPLILLRELPAFPLELVERGLAVPPQKPFLCSRHFAAIFDLSGLTLPLPNPISAYTYDIQH